MPIYEYQCAACGQITERWQKFSEEPLTVCPHCGGELHKLVSCCSFHLKGSGWYVTDYGGNQGAAASTETSGEANAAQGSADSPAKPQESKEPEKSAAPKFK